MSAHLALRGPLRPVVGGGGVAPVITTQPTTVSRYGNYDGTFYPSVSAAASGTPAPTCQWQESTSAASGFVDEPGATSLTWSGPTTRVSTAAVVWVRAVFTNTAGTATTDAVQIQPYEP